MESELIDLVAQGYLMKQKSLLSIDRFGHDIAVGDGGVVDAWARSVKNAQHKIIISKIK
jgi:hypothetical protein